MSRKLLICAIGILVILFGERTFYSVQGYYVVTGFEGAHHLARKILSKGSNPDKCLDIKYLKGKILPDYLTDHTMQDTCLEDIANSRGDPMICTKMTSYYTATSCGSDVYGGVFTGMLYDDLLADYYCSLEEDTRMVECSYTEYPPVPSQPYKKIETFSLNQCNKFSLERSQDWCRFFLVETVDDCDKLKVRYLRERCYFFYDQTCNKSSEPLLKKGCEANQIIEERFKDDPNRRIGHFW